MAFAPSDPPANSTAEPGPAAAAQDVCRPGWRLPAAPRPDLVLWLFGQIHYYATHDQARPADAIAVFGAAEYDGRPSPVLRARLDHALSLYLEKLAPLVITLGGGEGRATPKAA